VSACRTAFLDVGFGDALDGVAHFLGTSCAVSASITSVILCISPDFISRRITSTARSDMRWRVLMVIVSAG